MTNLSPNAKLAAAVMRVVEPPIAMAPYFGAVLRGLIRREMSPETEAMMISMGMKPTLFVTHDGVMQWSSSFIASIDVVEVAWSLIHEVGHIVLNHHARAVAQGIPVRMSKPEDMDNARLWNLAGDASWNAELRKMNSAPLPGFWVMPETLEQPEGLIVEERYNLLRQQVDKIKQKLGKAGAGTGSCGSCSGHAAPGEPEGGKSAEGRSEAEMERFKKQVAQDIQSAKDRGTIPESLKRWADDFLKPVKIDWRTKLARIVRGAVAYRSGCADFTYSKMSRRQAGVGYGVGRPVVPALHSPKPNVAIALDVSGSMGKRELSAALTEVRGVLSAVGAQVTFVVCDAEVHGIKAIKSVDEAVNMMVGGGGTYLEPAVEAISKLKDKPGIVIILTDGYCDDSPSYGLNLIWTIVGGNTTFSPTHGETVFVDEE
jgi:predicted metal-dependent peptidase